MENKEVYLELDKKRMRIGKKIGNGGYGTVYEVGSEYAGKLFELSIDCSTIRELAVLSYLSHPNIIKMIGYSFVDGKIMLVMEKAKSDLNSIINNIDSSQRKLIMFQLLNGINFIHNNNISHRDIKPHNILICNDFDIKICDFGLSKPGILENTTHTTPVVSLWYRAPEVILNPGKYDKQIDIWSAGIIFMQMILKDKFDIKDDYEIIILFKIFGLIGTPDEKQWSGLSQMENWKDTFPKFESTIDNILASTDADENEKDLLKKMLRYPLDRINAIDSLHHPYFDDMNENKNIGLLNNYISSNVIDHKINIYEELKDLFYWIIQLKQTINIKNTTLFTTFNMIYQYVKYKNIKKNIIKLVGLSCLYIVSLLLEASIFVIEDIYKLFRNFYTKIHIKNMIYNVLIYFKFNIIPMIIYDEIEDIQLKIISCCMTNQIIFKYWTFQKMIYFSKMVDKTPETFLIISHIECMPYCQLRSEILSYISTF